MFLKCFAENIITLYKEKRNKKNNMYKMNYILTRYLKNAMIHSETKRKYFGNEKQEEKV